MIHQLSHSAVGVFVIVAMAFCGRQRLECAALTLLSSMRELMRSRFLSRALPCSKGWSWPLWISFLLRIVVYSRTVALFLGFSLHIFMSSISFPCRGPGWKTEMLDKVCAGDTPPSERAGAI